MKQQDVIHSSAEFILYQTEDGRTRIEAWFQEETVLVPYLPSGVYSSYLFPGEFHADPSHL